MLVGIGLRRFVLGGVGGDLFLAALVGGGLCCLMSVAGCSRSVFGWFRLVLVGFGFLLLLVLVVFAWF